MASCTSPTGTCSSRRWSRREASARRCVKAGVRRRIRDRVYIGDKTTTARGKRYLIESEFDRQVNAGLLDVVGEERDARRRAEVVPGRGRAMGRERHRARQPRAGPRGRRQAEHPRLQRRGAPCLPHQAGGTGRAEDEALGEQAEPWFKEATVWIEGLDRVHKLRGINFCVDLSATPYFLGARRDRMRTGRSRGSSATSR